MMLTCASNRQSGPSVTSGPIVQNGPTSTSAASLALGSTTAKGEILGILAFPNFLSLYLKRLRVHQHELDIGLARQLFPNKSLAPDMPGAAFYPHRHRLQQQLIARHHRVAHLDLVHREQDRQLAGVFQLLAQQYAAELRHGLYDQDPGHDRRAGIMSLEEDVVEGDVLDPDRPLIPFDLQNAIDEQHRVAVRQDALDAPDVERRLALDQGDAGARRLLL